MMTIKEIKEDIIKNFVEKHYRNCISESKADDLQNFIIVSLGQLERAVETEYNTELNKRIASLAKIIDYNQISPEIRLTAGMYLNAVTEEKKRLIFNRLLENNNELQKENRRLRELLD